MECNALQLGFAIRKAYHLTLYEYVYDLIKDKTVGDNGTFYADFRNAMLKKYTDEGKVKYKEKLTYEQLNNLIK